MSLPPLRSDSTMFKFPPHAWVGKHHSCESFDGSATEDPWWQISDVVGFTTLFRIGGRNMVTIDCGLLNTVSVCACLVGSISSLASCCNLLRCLIELM